MARTPMARLPWWLIRTQFWVPTEFSQWLKKTNIEETFLILSWYCMLCLLIRIASSRRFFWVHATYHYFVEDRKHFHKLSPFASWPGAIIKSHWLELPISRTNFHGPKDVRAIEVWLYFSIQWPDYANAPADLDLRRPYMLWRHGLAWPGSNV